MIIFVKALTPSGPECAVKVGSQATIWELKHQVSLQLDIPPSQQRIVFRGKTLENDNTITSYGIPDGAKVHLFPVKDNTASSTPQGPLWSELKKFLEERFSESDADKVMREFQKIFQQSVESLSLDDVERIASDYLKGNPCMNTFK